MAGWPRPRSRLPINTNQPIAICLQALRLIEGCRSIQTEESFSHNDVNRALKRGVRASWGQGIKGVVPVPIGTSMAARAWAWGAMSTMRRVHSNVSCRGDSALEWGMAFGGDYWSRGPDGLGCWAAFPGDAGRPSTPSGVARNGPVKVQRGYGRCGLWIAPGAAKQTMDLVWDPLAWCLLFVGKGQPG